MVCIYCGKHTRITNSRSKAKSGQCWRRHRCLSCHAAFTTTEGYDLANSLLVEPENGVVKPFSPYKLYLSIYQTVEHLNNSQEIAGHLTQTVIDNLLSKKPLDPVINTAGIINAVSQVLKHYNAAAAVRYSSLNTNIQSVNDVKRLLRA